MRLAGGLRLFLDVPSTPRRAEILLLLSDIFLLAAPLLLVTAALDRPAPAVDTALLVLWAGIPRCVARLLGWIGHPRESSKVFLLSMVFVLVTSMLILTGWELVYVASPPDLPMGAGTAFLVLITWSSGFFLFQPRAYRLHDFLCGSVLLLGIFEQKPAPWIWAPLFLLALLFSSSTRHLLYDVYRRAPTPFLNLQNLRVLSVGGTLLATLVFFSLVLLFQGRLEFPEQRVPRSSQRAGRFVVDRFFALPPSPREERGRETRNGSLEERRAFLLEEPAGVGTYSYTGDLTSYATRPNDPKKALIVRSLGTVRLRAGEERAGAFPAGEATPSPAPPPEDGLFRGITFSHFDGAIRSWVEERPPGAKKPWPDGAVLTVGNDAATDRDLLVLEYEVALPVFPTLTSLLRTEAYRAGDVESYRQNAAGDVFPLPPPGRNLRYRALAEPLLANRVPRKPETGIHPDERYLRLPGSASLGFDLHELGRQVFAGRAASIQEKIGALRDFLQAGFRYSRTRSWKNRDRVLREFLLESRSGNCTHFTTAAALLLRTAGVSTRMAAGYGGGKWVPRRRELHLLLSMAHAWAEVYFPSSGWYAVDATAWVPRASSEDEDASDEGAISMGGATVPETLSGEELETIRPTRSSYTDGRRSGGPRSRGGRGTGSRGRQRDPRDTLADADDDRREEFFGWVEFADEGPAGSGDALAMDTRRTLSPGGFEARSVSRSGGGGARRSRQEPQTDPLLLSDVMALLRIPLRILLLIVALAAVGLLVESFRRSRKKREGTEQEDGSPAAAGLPGIGHAARGEDALDFDWNRPREAVIGNYHRLQEDLALARNHRRPAQTPLEHGRKFARSRRGPREAFQIVVQLFYRALYGTAPISPEDAANFERSCRKIRKLLS